MEDFTNASPAMTSVVMPMIDWPAPASLPDLSDHQRERHVIALVGKRGSGVFAEVSAEDVEFLRQWNWNATPKGYPIRTDRSRGRKQTIYMHRVIFERATGTKPPQVDHIDGNKLNCLRSNLRAATNQTNQANVPRQRNNTSGYKGVSWHVQHGKYQARICFNRNRIHLGFYDSPLAAHAAYCQAARRLFGEFSRVQ